MLAAVRRAGAAAILLLALPGPAEAVSQQDRICAHIRAVVQAKLDLGVGCDWEYPDNPLIFVAHVPREQLRNTFKDDAPRPKPLTLAKILSVIESAYSRVSPHIVVDDE